VDDEAAVLDTAVEAPVPDREETEVVQSRSGR
jgi:hypothetical protein